jgi:hypothetical protein
MMAAKQIAVLSCMLFLTGCAGSSQSSPATASFNRWVNSSNCTDRLVIAAPGTSKSEAQSLANQFRATVLLESSKPLATDLVYKGLTRTAGAVAPKSWGLARQLSDYLQTIDKSGRKWDIFAVKDASWLLSRTLEIFSEGSLSTTNSTVHLVGWEKSKAIEDELHRVSAGKFEVVYE